MTSQMNELIEINFAKFNLKFNALKDYEGNVESSILTLILAGWL